jgi:4-hydroxyphenylacetate decarboxylase large subunit
MAVKTKLADILAEKGLPINFQFGGEAPEEMTAREVTKEPSPRANRLRDIYYDTLSTANTEFPYWYTRRWNELEGEVDVVRRAESLKAAFSHLHQILSLVRN